MKKVLYKPHTLATVKLYTSTRRRVVECISHPFPKDGGATAIKIRMVPGDPTTMTEVNVDELQPHQGQKKYIHVAEATGCFSFPEDMLRYDYAALYDHEQPESLEHGWRPKERVLIYRVTDTKDPRWTDARWESFSWQVKTLTTLKLGTDQFISIEADVKV